MAEFERFETPEEFSSKLVKMIENILEQGKVPEDISIKVPFSEDSFPEAFSVNPYGILFFLDVGYNPNDNTLRFVYMFEKHDRKRVEKPVSLN